MRNNARDARLKIFNHDLEGHPHRSVSSCCSRQQMCRQPIIAFSITMKAVCLNQ